MTVRLYDDVLSDLNTIAIDASDTNNAYKGVLVADENTDITLIDGTKTPSLSKRVNQKITNMNPNDFGFGDVVKYNVSELEIYIKDNSNFKVLESVSELLSLTKIKNKDTILVKSYHIGLNKGGGIFVYDETKKSLNDGGMILNGWVRINQTVQTPYMFGAYGDWNATTEIGNDDTIAFQKCSDYILKKEHMRNGNYHTMYIPAGNYKITNWNLHQIQYTFGFNVYGDGEGTQLWLDRSGNGISVNIEYTQFKDMVFNGNTIAKIDATKPPIPYIFRFKSADKRLDVDVTFTNCKAIWFNTFARVVGRGFTVNDGNFGMGANVLEIACDTDINIMGEIPQMHSIENAMRHFVFNSIRTDIVETLIKITGTHAIKDYINGITVNGSEFTRLNRIITSTDCTLIKLKLINNIAIGSFESQISSGAIDVPRAIGVLDLGNSWMNYPNDSNVTTDRTKGISFIHRYSISVEDLQIINSTMKDLIWGVVQAGKINGLIIKDNIFKGFADFDNTSALIQLTGVEDSNNFSIVNNIFKSKTTKTRKWIQYKSSNFPMICNISNNNADNMPKQGIPFLAKLYGGNTELTTYTVNDAIYNCTGNVAKIDLVLSTNISAVTGNIAIGLPFNGVAINATFGGISGINQVPLLSGFASGNYILESRSGSDNKTYLKLNNANVTTTNKTSDVLSIICNIEYRIK